MSWVAAAVVGGSVIGGVVASKSASKAAKATGEASSSAIEEQRRQFDITEERLLEQQDFERARQDEFNLKRQQEFDELQRPFLSAGVEAVGQQRALLGLAGETAQQQAFEGISDSPGQRFLRERGQRNLVRNAAAIGGLGGGNVREALVQQGVGFAQQDLQNQFGRLGQVAGQGLSAPKGAALDQRLLGAAGQIGQFGAQASSNIQNSLLASGAARASGILGQNQAFQQTLGNVFTGLAQTGLFSGSDGFTLPASNTSPFSRRV